jgi:YD repeat-containing protein
MRENTDGTLVTLEYDAEGHIVAKPLTQEEIENRPKIPYALIDMENRKIIDIIRAIGASQAIAQFDLMYPERKRLKQTIWLLIGRENEDVC